MSTIIKTGTVVEANLSNFRLTIKFDDGRTESVSGVSFYGPGSRKLPSVGTKVEIVVNGSPQEPRVLGVRLLTA